jgi:delta 1-pyrroline-5-carboxylate dehydrogenase
MHQPIGVVAAITPWNSPIASDAQKIAPALAAGNAVLLKPASWSPLVSLELARIIDEAGLPKGLFSTLPARGPWWAICWSRIPQSARCRLPEELSWDAASPARRPKS